jgi:leucyl/phenylalanyl-tRNA--protein transferase
VWQVEAWGFTLFDCQLPTPHLASLGAKPWPRERFLAALDQALQTPTRRGHWVLEPGVIAARLA